MVFSDIVTRTNANSKVADYTLGAPDPGYSWERLHNDYESRDEETDNTQRQNGNDNFHYLDGTFEMSVWS